MNSAECCQQIPMEIHPDHNNPEHSHGKRRSLLPVLISFALAVVCVLLSMPQMFHREPSNLTLALAFSASLLIVILFGRHFIFDTWKLFHASNMNTLVGLGILGSYGLSIWNWKHGNLTDIYFDSAAFVAAFVLLGQWIEFKIREKMNLQMKSLTGLLPQMAHLISNDGVEKQVRLTELQPGDRLRVLMGERVPADSRLTAAKATFDLSLVTGESKPVLASLGDEIPQGALNAGQPIELEVLRKSENSLYQLLVTNVQKTLSERPAIQRKVDLIAKVFVPFVVVLAIATGIAWKLWLSPQSAVFMITSIAVLVVACPCALGIATPSALLVGVWRASRNGILFKSLDASEKASDISLVAFDKTGTLTYGRPEITKLKAVENFSHKDLLQLALSVERTSEHPYAQAVRRKAALEGVRELPATEVVLTPGKGVIGKINRDGKTQEVCVGNLVWLFENGYDSTKVPTDFQWDAEGTSDTVLWVGADQAYLGLLFLGDEVRPEAREIVQWLLDEGYNVGMITGDAENVAKAVAKALKLKFYHSGVLPNEKATIVKRLSAPKKKGLDMISEQVAFIGDGINDAPALAEARLGIAMGSGAALSQSTADLILVANKLDRIKIVFQILRQTQSLIRQNLILSFGYNILMIPIAMGIFYPKFHLLLNPAIAALAMASSSITVLLNSLRAMQSPTKAENVPEKIMRQINR